MHLSYACRCFDVSTQFYCLCTSTATEKSDDQQLRNVKSSFKVDGNTVG